MPPDSGLGAFPYRQMGGIDRPAAISEVSLMDTRTSSRQVTFRKPFTLAGLDGVQPPGTYTITTEEEMLDSLTIVGWRQTAVTMAIVRDGATEFVTVDPQDFREALARDDSLFADSHTPAPDRSRRARNLMRRGGRP